MKKGKKFLAGSLAMAMVLSSFAGSGITADAKAKKAVSSVSIKNVDSSVLVLKKGSSFKLKTKVTATGGASKKVSFSSSKKKIVSVSSKGVLKAKKKGNAKITVKSVFNKKKKAVLTVKVGTPIKKITLQQSDISMKVGETAELAVTLSPKSPTHKKLSYSSSNEKVATVNGEGVITAVAAGNAKITVKATDGSKKKAVAKVMVTGGAAASGQPNDKPATAQPSDNPATQKPSDNPATEKPSEAPATQKPSDNPATEKPDDKIVYTENDLVWKDDFEGNSLNEKDWNYELHEPGWVNDELQEYVKNENNIYVKDGNLVIKAIKTKDGYTSGRINTQGKHDFKYGKFETKIKVPEGMGFLPAFWMMPTDENLYGQWPKCGEIDIMEVMGQNNKLAYGTIHYGEPHRESQGEYTLTEGNFTDDYHVFSCEWEPGKISWYVDGVLFHEESDWFSAKSGQGTISYPAPFDQPFYMILNLAVGGSWVGNPDETTSFDNAELVVDYVKVYQKEESAYDENVKKPEKEVILRDPDANGNYVNNGNFVTAESLEDETDWQFMTALEGEAQAAIGDGAIKITTTKEGTVDYSVQLVQAGIPFEKGATYKVSFDAKASAARTMKTSVKAPDYGYAEYMPSKIVELTTEQKSYSYEFKMTGDSDANGRLEFNMGAAGSTADISITNVKIEKIKDVDPNEKEEKVILADGNHVYNGAFQEGEGRLGYWEITNNAKADISVTNIKNDRYLKVIVDRDGKAEDVKVGQSDLALTGNMKYALTFDAWADAAKTMKVEVAGESYEAQLTTEKKTYSFKFTTPAQLSKKDIVFYMGEKGTICLDNVNLLEDTLIKNGSFDAGFSGYDPFVDSSADASYVVDSQSEDNAADFTIRNTGDQEWKIQLKQENVCLEKGKWYTLKFDAKSSLDRKIQYSIQRNGNVHKKEDGEADWTPYVQANASLTKEYQTIERTFQMKEDTDEGSVFNIAMGAVDEQIVVQHRICIDNISLEEIEEPAEEPNANLLKNADFSDDINSWTETIAIPDWGNEYTAQAKRSLEEGKIKYEITDVGSEDWHVQLKQENISLEKGCTYRVSFDILSTVARTVLTGVMSADYVPYDQGKGTLVLESGINKSVSFDFTMDKDDATAQFYISMGKIKDVVTPASTITISDLSLVKIPSEE